MIKAKRDKDLAQEMKRYDEAS